MCSNSLFPCSCYRDAVGAAEETRIREENIQGAVLLLSTKDDTMCPSYEAMRRIVRRLEDGGFRYPVIERAYHRAGHYLTCFQWKAAGTNCLPTPAVTRRTIWPPPATHWRRRLTFSTAGNREKAV